nr:hypothetical protein GCM10017745_38580 [Saccharothrix mutabilis subsp. capreolus]
MQRSGFSEVSRAEETLLSRAVRSRSTRNSSRARRTSVSSTSHHVTAPSACGTGCASYARSPIGPEATGPPAGKASCASASQSTVPRRAVPAVTRTPAAAFASRTTPPLSTTSAG